VIAVHTDLPRERERSFKKEKVEVIHMASRVRPREELQEEEVGGGGGDPCALRVRPREEPKEERQRRRR
jgi:hypothetical protein